MSKCISSQQNKQLRLAVRSRKGVNLDRNRTESLGLTLVHEGSGASYARLPHICKLHALKVRSQE